MLFFPNMPNEWLLQHCVFVSQLWRWAVMDRLLILTISYEIKMINYGSKFSFLCTNFKLAIKIEFCKISKLFQKLIDS